MSPLRSNVVPIGVSIRERRRRAAAGPRRALRHPSNAVPTRRSARAGGARGSSELLDERPPQHAEPDPGGPRLGRGRVLQDQDRTGGVRRAEQVRQRRDAHLAGDNRKPVTVDRTPRSVKVRQARILRL